jgi:uncharacterized protein (DUF58 family)
MSRWARPARPVAPIGVAAGILGIWWVVAHNGGSGWVQALGDIVFGTLVVGIFGPAAVLSRAKVRVLHAPLDGVAGMPSEVCIETSTRLRVRPVAPPGEEVLLGPPERGWSPDVQIKLLPSRRGVHEAVTLDIATAAPFALQWWTRRVVLPLPAALHIAPRRGRPVSLVLRPNEDAGLTANWTQAEVGEPRGARPYRPGDSRRQVHWRATAHAGALMVRELEGPSAEPVTLTVTLPWDPIEAEHVAERALGTVVQFLERNAPVILATVEPGGSVVSLVTDRRGAARRLARAVPEPQSRPTIARGVAAGSE